jgi:uncharacterized protein YndB with AHSA1/START domain
MLKRVFIILATIIVILCIVIAMQPADFRVARSATIAAPVGAVFAQVNDLHKWREWSPWAKRDPNAKNSYEGPVAGVGAAFMWSGNSEVGEGKMTIIESRKNEKVVFRLEFEKPFEATSNAEFTFKESAGQTQVTWAMTGKNNFIGKAISLVMNCDKMIGKDFEKGLAQLDAATAAALK